MLKKQKPLDEVVEAVHEVDADDTADVAARDHAPLVAEHVVHERVDVAGVHREVVDVVGREVAVAVPAQVGDDDLEARRRERRDVAPPDPLGLGVAVEQQQRVPADALAHVRERRARRARRSGGR